MSIGASESELKLPISIPYRPVRISVAEYHEWARSGALAERGHIELLDGVLVERTTKHPPHRVATRKCDLLLAALVPAGWHVQKQEPITLATSEPEPDVAIIRGRLEDYRQRHPDPTEIAIVVEVADATLVTDRYKAEIYAGAGIAHYWIINLVEKVVEVYSQPRTDASPARYAKCQIYLPGEAIPVVVEGGEWGEISAAEIVG